MTVAVASAGPKVASGTLMLHLLGRCNLSCVHCYMEGGPTREEQLPVEVVLRAISECEELGVTSLYLTGGEALLYRQLDAVLQEAARVPDLKVTVSTNGMLVTEQHAEVFRELGVHVNVSVDGAEEFHDRFRRRRGAFRATERGIRTLVGAGVAVSIVTTITRRNRASLRGTMAWAADVGATGVFVLPLLKLGRAAAMPDESLDDFEMDQMLLELSDLGNAYRSQRVACQLNGVATRRFLMTHPCGAYVCNGSECHRGVAKELKKLVVREDGTVLPEMTNISHKFALGNLRDASLATLVAHYLEHDYGRFDALCRETYNEVLPGWRSTIVPWDEIVASRSEAWMPRVAEEPPLEDCHACGCGRATCAPHAATVG